MHALIEYHPIVTNGNQAAGHLMVDHALTETHNPLHSIDDSLPTEV